MDEKGLYIHIPFCRRKCPYCDFYSVEGDSSALMNYAVLLPENMAIVQRGGQWTGPFDTVFFGGGTPSLLDPSDVARILDAARSLFGLSPDAEISLEANPGTVSCESLEGYRAAGVNRLSFGVQSFDSENLRLLGRIHSANDVLTAVEHARLAGFEKISCDLIFGLPGQTESLLASDLEHLIELRPDHLSCYALTIEEGTPLYHSLRGGSVVPLGEDEVADQFLLLHDSLTRAGFAHYEISNYARPGFECRHNLLYWRRRSCLGIGAGAHSFDAQGWGDRRVVPGDLRGYRAEIAAGKDPSRHLEGFDRRGAMAETLYLGLRMAEGVSEEAFRGRFGIGVSEAYPRQVERHAGRLSLVSGFWRLDLQGWLLFDHLIADFL